MSLEENKRVVRRLFEEVYNQGSLSVIDDLFAEHALGHDPTREEPVRGVESYRLAATSFLEAFPDLRVSLDDLVAEGDRVAARWTLVGHHEGTFMGVPPSGNLVREGGMIIYRLAEGRIAEYWGATDMLALMRQLSGIGD